MSLAKLARTTVIAGSPAVAFRPYSHSCPHPAPAPVPAQAPSSSGGGSGCVQVPIYGRLPVIGPYGNQNGAYTYGVIGYQTVCFP